MWEEYPFLSRNDTHSKPRVGISACLSGEQVRYDGQSKPQPELIDHLVPLVELNPLCPEVAIGMGVPRSPIQLVLEDNQIDAVKVEDSESFSEPLRSYASLVIEEQATQATAQDKICGYIFKSRSPSCGAGSTPVFSEGVHINFGDGIFAHSIRRSLPWLPIMEEEDLAHPRSRHHFSFLVYLVSDFYLTIQQENNLQGFVEHHGKLLKALPKSTRTKLDAIKRRFKGSNDQHLFLQQYLTPLIQQLQAISHQDIESVLSGA